MFRLSLDCTLHTRVFRTGCCALDELAQAAHPAPLDDEELLLPFELVADASLWERDTLAFTCGSHAHSVLMDTEDWETLAAPRRLRFSR